MNSAGATSKRPPVLHDGKPSPPRLNGTVGAPWRPVGVVLGFAGLIALTRLATHWHLPFPQCWLRKLTGIPCPTCGCTRSLLAWSELDLVQAFFLNPLFFLGCAGVLAGSLLLALEKLSGRAWLSQRLRRIGRRRLWQALAALTAVNWLYLCLHLPK